MLPKDVVIGKLAGEVGLYDVESNADGLNGRSKFLPIIRLVSMLLMRGDGRRKC